MGALARRTWGDLRRDADSGLANSKKFYPLRNGSLKAFQCLLSRSYRQAGSYLLSEDYGSTGTQTRVRLTLGACFTTNTVDRVVLLRSRSDTTLPVV